MSWYPKFRDVHLWAGLIVMIPVIVIAATGIGLNHEELLGLKGYAKAERHGEKHGRDKEKGDKEKGRGKGSDGGKSRRDRGSSPSNMNAPAVAELPGAVATHADVKSSAGLESKSGSWNSYASAMDEAVAAARGVWGADVPLERIELKHESSAGMVVKVKAARSAKVEPDEVIWSVAERTRLLRPEDEPRKAGSTNINWAKVVKDLHTGKFFSKEYGYFWSDVAAGALVLLSLTGLVLYLIPVLKKVAKKNRSMAARPVASGARAARPQVAAPQLVASQGMASPRVEPQGTV